MLMDSTLHGHRCRNCGVTVVCVFLCNRDACVCANGRATRLQNFIFDALPSVLLCQIIMFFLERAAQIPIDMCGLQRDHGDGW